MLAKALLLAVLTLCFGSAVAQTTRKPRPAPSRTTAGGTAQIQAEKEAIEELHQKDIQYSLAFDVDGLSSLWADDIVSLPPGEPALVGRAANLDYLKKQEQQIKNQEILSYEEQWDEVNVFGDYAWERGTIRNRIRPAVAGNEEMTVAFKVVRILKRQPDGSYRIARSIWNSLLSEAPKVQPKAEEPPPNRDLTR